MRDDLYIEYERNRKTECERTREQEERTQR